jgi:hypothetical protein
MAGQMIQGPNVKRLIAHKMSLLLIPPGSGKNAVGVAVANMTKPGNLSAVAREATAWVEAAIAAVKAAPGGAAYGDDEAIAGTILKAVEERQARFPPAR